MDQLREILTSSPMNPVFTFWETLINLGLAFVLCLSIVLVYRRTHWGTSYSQSFAQSLVIMGCVVAVIMMIIGSNIARAFSLVGALSIIRFRNAVKDSRDTAFVFFVMGVGMACGTGFYLIAILLSTFLSVAILGMDTFGFGRKIPTDKLLRLRVPTSVNYQEALPAIFEPHVISAELISADTVSRGELFELVYRLRFRPKAAEPDFIKALLDVTTGHPVTLVHRDPQIDI